MINLIMFGLNTHTHTNFDVSFELDVIVPWCFLLLIFGPINTFGRTFSSIVFFRGLKLSGYFMNSITY